MENKKRKGYLYRLIICFVEYRNVPAIRHGSKDKDALVAIYPQLSPRYTVNGECILLQLAPKANNALNLQVCLKLIGTVLLISHYESERE